MSNFNTRGFKSLEKTLKDMERKAKQFENGKNVPFDELFTQKFMNKYTNFSTFDDFLTAGNFHVQSQEDFEAIPDDEMDQHVSKTTRFNTWEEMLNTAGKEYLSKELGF